ncbi:MAG: T9SS type A sorting domain-containing protein [Chitinivibrionales bacterium]|nr:T9SS type A sorting domain-containing protein [Chitinivibrionales bacterium]
MKPFFCLLLSLSFVSYAQIGLKTTIGSAASVMESIIKGNLRASSLYQFQTPAEDKIEAVVENFLYNEGYFSLTGTVPESNKSAVMLKGDRTEVYGWVVLHDKNRAFEYTTDNTGAVSVEEVLVSKVYSIQTLPTPQDQEPDYSFRKPGFLNKYATPPAPHIGKYPGTDVRKLQSLPGASKVMYCNITKLMNGETPNNMTKEDVWVTWQCVANGYSSLQINVTTDADVYAKAGASNSGILEFLDQTGRSSSYMGIFGTGRSATCYRHIQNADKNGFTAGRTALHESGHVIGVADYGGQPGGTYFEGFPDFKWVPIMGNFWKANPWKENAAQQWSKGEYNSATVKSDVLQVMNKYFQFRPDDIAQTKPLVFSGATKVLPESNFGQISTNTDSDGFTFEIADSKGHATLKIDRIEDAIGCGMLDIDASIVDGSGKVVIQQNPKAARYAQLDTDLPQGKYTLIVKGGAEGTPQTGFSTYGSLGFYGISGEITGGKTSITTVENIKKLVGLNPITTNGKVHLDIPELYPIEKIAVFSANGTRLFSTHENVRSIDLTSVAAGIYMLAIAVDGSQILSKIVKK